jgi:hypothetical protein
LLSPGVCVHELGDIVRGCGNLAFAVGYTHKERSPRCFAPRDDGCVRWVIVLVEYGVIKPYFTLISK